MELKAFVRANADRVLAVALVVGGLIALVAGWFGVSGTGLPAEQNPYLISGGVAGIALIAIGCTVWLSSDMQDEWRRLDALEDLVTELLAAQGRAPDGAAANRHPNGSVAGESTDAVATTPVRGGARHAARTSTS